VSSADPTLAGSRAPRVLLGTGDKVSLTHVRELLNKSGYGVVVASDGNEVLRQLEANDAPSLAVLDSAMAGLTGAEVCRRLRSGHRRQYTYVILLTQWNQPNDRVEGLVAGADDCLFKPVDMRELRIRLQIGAQLILERALRESEERFQSAFECAGIGMALVTTNGEFQQVNRALCDLLGYPADELLNLNLFSLGHPDNNPPLRALLDQFIEGERRSTEFETRFFTREMSLVWASFTLARVVDADQRLVCFVVQLQEITRRKEAEEALRRREELLRAITENADDLVLLADTNFRWLYASNSFRFRLGYQLEELLGSNALQIIHPDDVEAVTRAVSEVIRVGEPRTMNLRYRHKNGTWHHVETVRSPFRNQAGEAEGYVVIARLIDDRIEAQQKLEAAYAETELFLRSIPSILIGLDSNGQITRWNLTASTILGLDEKQVMGRRIEDCGVKWLVPDMKAEVGKWLATESSYRCDDVRCERDGKIRFLGLNVRCIPATEEGSGPRFIITGADVTDRRALEEQLRQAQKMEAIGQLAAGVAHEINTPTQYVGDNTRFLKESWENIANFLQFCTRMREQIGKGAVSSEALQQFAQLCEKTDLDYLLKEIPQAIDQSLEGLQRVAKIVRSMKEFSHPGAEEKRATDLNRAIETTVTVARNEWKYCADLETDFDENLPLVPCLAGEFNQVMLNLVINAAHAIIAAEGENPEHKGKIVISTRHVDGTAQIAVSDSGTGIAEDIRSRIFDPFFTTKPLGKGSGQGLALAHSVIVNRHQGRIWFETEVGHGTTFFIRLPLAMGPAPS